MHDALFKASFGQPDIARSELELVLPRAVLEHLEMSTLAVASTAVVDEELRSTHSDLLFSVRTRTGSGGEAFFHVLFEHQSSFDATMPLLLAARPPVAAAEVRTILMTVAGPRGREDVMNAGQQLIEQGRVEGREEGKAEGLRTAIANLLSARGLPLSEPARATLVACDDIGTLTRWHTRAVTASSEAEVFAG